jgi:hypothetical protein
MHMRLLLLGLAAAALAPATAAPNSSAEKVLVPDSGVSRMPVVDPDSRQPKDCPHTAAYLAERNGKPLAPHKLTELPPATTFMAVYRHIGGCDAPLTMADYRSARRR